MCDNPSIMLMGPVLRQLRRNYESSERLQAL